jgi:uncharacterized protein YPO0396
MNTITTTSRKKRAQAAEAKVFVAPCNRLPSATKTWLADKMVARLGRKLDEAIETATTRLADFNTKMTQDAFNAFDWSGKSALDDAAKQRAAMEVKAALDRFAAANDGYAGGNSEANLHKVNDWMVNEIVSKVRYSSNMEPKDLARLRALAEFQDDMRFGFFELDFQTAQPVSVAQDYEGAA